MKKKIIPNVSKDKLMKLNEGSDSKMKFWDIVFSNKAKGLLSFLSMWCGLLAYHKGYGDMEVMFFAMAILMKLESISK